MLAKQFRLRYSSQQRNKRGNEEQKKGIHMGKTMLGKNRGSRKSDTMQSKFSILEMEDVGNLEMDMNEEGMRNKEVANQPKNPMT